ncbi:MAG TPA: redoxin family protein [Rubrivivax sp.]|nr:redoxin family protein [Rubrivivax sp.]
MTLGKVGRRRVLVGGVGVTAAACGAGAYVWRTRHAAGPTEPSGHVALWQATFLQPDGVPLVMSQLRGSPLVLNFWATWCPPCVKEMPELDRFAREFAARGVRVVGLALDNAGPVRQFLQRTPVSYAIGLAGFEGTELARSLGNDRGGLPFTAFFDRRGRLAQRKLGETNFDELAGWVQAG